MKDWLSEQRRVPLQFYATASYPCSYLPAREARSLVATPAQRVDANLYGQLIQHGFRRSGEYVYRPRCADCQACIPVRLAVAAFAPSRSQRRAWRRHAALQAQRRLLAFDEAHFQLYRRYQQSRHPGGGMDQEDRNQYENFILQSQVDSFLVEFHEDGVLRMVSLIDLVDDGLSSVYTFYDPDVPGASYGVYNILWQIGLARELGLPWLYLGYWIADCRKMAYKRDYQPLEVWSEAGGWQPMGSAG